ncbi:MAG: glucose-6-phosphate dehydrogenase [Chloroflexota bacterium]|nr:MAG: glucose-6-phosphate dehydrogenase [Chloroflexota bacterium]
MTETTSIIIFGASGDLTHRKLLPALFNLFRKKRIPGKFQILGFATRAWDDDQFRLEMEAAATKFCSYDYSYDEWLEFSQHLYYLSGNFTNRDDFQALAARLENLEDGPADRMFYLATAPRFFLPIVQTLGQLGLVHDRERKRRVVVEKPIGTDLASAQALNQGLNQVLQEEQIFRIDHYLGKESVQNLLVFRFANAIFEPIWNRNYIDHVQITVAEEVGVGHRAGYYDSVGVLRDMFQNHILQLVALVAMEPPANFDADAIRDEKLKVLRSIRPITPDKVASVSVRGQYRGYCEYPGVAPRSQTETFAALRLNIDNWRWQDVPFYLRSGKKLAEKCTEIAIQFKCPPIRMFPLPKDFEMTANILGMCIQPDEGIHLKFEAKVPDTAAETRSVDMEFHYRDSFGETSIPEAYERLCLDALQGDATLFTRAGAAELSWKYIDPILAAWKSPDGPPLTSYEPGSWGPEEAHDLLAKDHRWWIRTCGENNGQIIDPVYN